MAKYNPTHQMSQTTILTYGVLLVASLVLNILLLIRI
jgi:hypothetical protein